MSELQRLQQDVARLQATVARLNCQWRLPPPGRDYLLIVIDKGNELETGQDGVVYTEDPITSVPAAYDADVDDSFIDGIGRGVLYKNLVAQDGYVLVVNDGRGSFRNALVQGDAVWAGRRLLMPVDGGGSVTVYGLA